MSVRPVSGRLSITTEVGTPLDTSRWGIGTTRGMRKETFGPWRLLFRVAQYRLQRGLRQAPLDTSPSRIGITRDERKRALAR